ncbi:uncharacterized protein LOC131228149 [Magnolia sinica]|uniref:uncharacterized protein LOC131228149 n=1 Tax=Magnolia sinica TaxID=86752 RepID=UPI0026590639|nr:uncharacterized protein LOC131228149 [Magnolia sinica]
MTGAQKADAHKPFWKTLSNERGEKRFPFTLYEENQSKFKAVLGPGGGFGVGCGVGIGVGVVGGAGYGGGPWNHLNLAFGVGMGCGIGVGFGYGNGFGLGLGLSDFEARFLGKRKRDSKWIVIDV